MTLLNHTKPISSFEGFYTIYENGKIFSVRRGIYLKSRPNRNGYHVVCLYANGLKKWVTVHGLVAKTFLGPRPLNFTVNHKNGNKDDNSLSNLEYVSLSDNIKHAYRTGLKSISEERKKVLKSYRMGEKPPNRALTDEQAKSIIEEYGRGGISMKALGEKWGISASAVCLMFNKKTYKSI